MKYIILALLIPSITLACDKPVTFLPKGTTTQCDLYGFTPDKEREVRLGVVDLDYYKGLSASQTHQVGLYKEENKLLESQVNLWRDQSTRLSKELTESKSKSTLTLFLWFGLGVLTTTAITYGVNQR
jgi:hypothetical protein